jgi:putative acetyltransferase
MIAATRSNPAYVTCNIRRETSSDHEAITAVVNAAFQGMPYAEGDEAALVTELRRVNALTVSLVAELNSVVIGHIAFSPARAVDGTPGWYGLGPLAVLPEHQKQGIGSALLHAGLDELAHLNAHGCILVGYPQLYTRFGFYHAPANAPQDEPPEFFMIKVLQGNAPCGPVYFHEAFKHVG